MGNRIINLFLKEKYSQFSLILLLWVILTGININKAYHIDDTFHLEAANEIRKNPLKPMSGLINWDHIPTSIYKHNQPPLFFYIIFLTESVFGDSELVMHLLLSIFTFLSLYYFWKLLQLFTVKHKKTILVIFAFCPAFIINQNLMTDVPILAIALGTMYFLLKGLNSNNFNFFFISALLLSAGLLIKYSLLPIFFVFLISIILSKNYKNIIVLLIPISLLLLWSIWNVNEFNSSHLQDRPRLSMGIGKIIGFLGALGSISIFSSFFLYSVFPKKLSNIIILGGVSFFTLSIPLVYFSFINESLFNQLLNYLFIINGFVVIAFVINKIIQSLLQEKGAYFESKYFPIALYIMGLSVFISLFAPFIATRHILLIVPFLLIFGHKQFEKSNSGINKLVLFCSIIAGVMFGVSDWFYADFYRNAAEEIKIEEGITWSIGHWGWQWYSKEAGMKVYSTNDESKLRKNDLVVFPKDVPRQYMNPDIKLDTIGFYTEKSNFMTFISGKNFASMYSSHARKPAWSLSSIPIDTVFICKVSKEKEVDEVTCRLESE